MQSSIQETSTTLVIDLVSKFLFKLLGKDANYAHYLKHWTSFREVLYDTPHFVNPALSYISSLDAQVPQSKPTRPRPSELSGVSSSKNTDLLNLSGNNSDMSFEDIKPVSKISHTRTYSSHQGSYTSSPDEKSRINSYKPSNFRQESALDNSGQISERLRNKFLPENKLSCVSRNASNGNADGTESPEYTVTDNILAGIKSTTPYQLSFLSSLSRKLTSNIRTHTDEIIKGPLAKKEDEFIMEERSPLRKLKVHGKKEDNLDLLSRIEKIYEHSITVNNNNIINNNKNLQAQTFTLKHWIV
jgi:hypothetical protein